jgi:hypothetical protein
MQNMGKTAFPNPKLPLNQLKSALCPTSVVLTDQKRTVHFKAALHFYSIANFVAWLLKWLQMISNDFKKLQMTSLYL